MANEFIRKLLSGYRITALMLMNTLVVLLVLNVVLFAVFSAGDDDRRDPVTIKYGHETLGPLYPGWSESEITALLKETWFRPYIYEPFTQFKERPYQGHYVNVDTSGFRETKNQGTWPPQPDKLNIFLFGGSTLFGYGVADDQTVASYLQAALIAELDREVRVYNFGRGHYYSTQERILYEHMLAAGIIPDVALFLDGLNDFHYHSNEPLYTRRFRKFVEQGQVTTRDRGFISGTSLGRAARSLRKRFTKLLKEDQHNERQHEKTNADPDTTNYADTRVLDAVIHRYLQNKKLIEAASASFGVTPVFVWQPVPTYQYDQQYHPFSARDYGKHNYAQYGYERMAERLRETPLGDNFLWLAGLQKNKTVPLYVDRLHYSGSFSEEIAAEIATVIIDRSLIGETGQRAE